MKWPDLFVSMGLLISALLFATCISPIEFNTEATAIPIVSGVISNSPLERSIRVSEIQEIGSDPLAVKASVSLYKNGQFAVAFEEIETGHLVLPLDYLLEAGAQYYLDIHSASGHFQSYTQEVLPLVRNQALEWEIDRRRQGESHEGVPIEISLLDLYTLIEIGPAQEPESFFRWQVEDVWLHKEIPRPFVDTTIVIDSNFVIGVGIVYDTMVLFTPDTAKECYPKLGINQHPSTIIRTDGLDAGLARVKVLQREVDQSFLFQHYFNVYLHRIDERAYQFYERAERLIQRDGSIYDEIPAPIQGNLFNVDDEAELVLGYVELSLADTIRVGLDRNDLGIFLFDDCRPISGPIGCPPEGGFGVDPDFPIYCKCYDCDKIYGAETLIKPPYWE